MHAWAVPDQRPLPGTGAPVWLRDTASGETRVAASGTRASMYVCGITPYDATHLGHAATYVAFDVLNRAWRDAGHDVRYVQNVTDIDDPLLERAESTGQDWAQLAAEQTELFRQDMAWLRVLPPDRFVSAVDAIPQIIDVIGRLRDTGAVYEVEGDLYFSVRADSRFGFLSGLDAATMRELFAERGGDPERTGKKDPLDCLLWRKARPGEPAWESPFGAGRPGWHIECTAIALDELGAGFDVQGGGSDLIFPHHEMCASGAHVLSSDQPFAHLYAHAGMVGYEGSKMSKSLGNLVFAESLRLGDAEPGAVRLALYTQHYRSDREWSEGLLRSAGEQLARWRAAVAAPAGPDARPVVEEVRQRLADDLDTAGASRAVDRWVDETLANGGEEPSAPSSIAALADSLLGIRLVEAPR
ncbi:cysteine--1-D-myo-inosityl 2-amino-2-deoxy-alpha-D-glucopyranoside ligase [Actinobacteria bacterium YIM 96077]|uniref:L-cysteine:1D-myo-inositol 2-amino-2-deoxy-alpha-D-glucopyranoside ligase n=1 Tax=Phytoactinopolyspora halophila TaxID=1981511 RepID=A0A329QER7_9ACTN|nr:cysteine--1-D-myo-inosityl 2-amino-2-deoxy-alpha-D-glucopyranoside ligase [Phytoactinopolyspora halophila]AYY13474.1 cysteine--1-D-myo-inosityl 2-amino-2-deoxy-alpha-D-glucopyranoside ligase [Actinobacteria bacterium YIM 96077]RAW10867.1 cysteine--1-D-myo-inosityl 2-amino-2-deoxy-alpha-D-glucopyranoside ligase [Phytoactinopolyspora halophila]